MKNLINYLKEISELYTRVAEYKKGGIIHIKKKNRGKFTASAKKAGKSIQEYAKDIMNNQNATPLQRRRANFAIQAKRWHKK